MSNALTISDVGLRLIKAYEGFRPVDVELVSGQRVAGYGHRVMGGESLHLSEKKAAKLLKSDLAPYEAMINDCIFAPVTQSQFDALCSLAFNIGPKKFLHSDVVRALNNGRVLDAANGFDVWRKGQINGESYVVDALVRRRTAEKVLFLRPSLRAVRAPRVDLVPTSDDTLQNMSTAAPEPIFEGSGHVSIMNFDASRSAQTDAADDMSEIDEMFVERRNPANTARMDATPMRRRDDRPGGVLTLSEVFDDDAYMDDSNDPLIANLDGFNLDIEDAPLELDGMIDYDDVVLPDDVAETSYGAELKLSPEPTYDDITDLPEYDPSDYIVGDYGSETHGDGDAIELTDLEQDLDPDFDAGPSPIATAAAEVSGRLDALMAQSAPQAPETDKKVLPFRTKSSAKILADDPDVLRKDNPLYGSLIGTDTSKAQSEEAAQANPLKRDNSDADTAAQKDSASRYIANTIAPAQSPNSKTGLAFMVMTGMALLGGSVGAMLSGVDERFGMGGEFLATLGALFGLMITLGSVYYVLKNKDDAA